LSSSSAKDPVRLGLVASLARTGGNATGVNLFVGELGSKQLGLLHELVPAVSRVGLLVNPNVSGTERATKDVSAAALTFGLQIDIVQASDSRGIESAFEERIRNRAGAILVGPDGEVTNPAGGLKRQRGDQQSAPYVEYSENHRPNRPRDTSRRLCPA
jgi:ABC-type uncharacterized transport system substrate-binding protein